MENLVTQRRQIRPFLEPDKTPRMMIEGHHRPDGLEIDMPDSELNVEMLLEVGLNLMPFAPDDKERGRLEYRLLNIPGLHPAIQPFDETNCGSPYSGTLSSNGTGFSDPSPETTRNFKQSIKWSGRALLSMILPFLSRR